MRFSGFKGVPQDFDRKLKIEFLTFLLHPNVLNELLICFNSKNRHMYMIWVGLLDMWEIGIYEVTKFRVELCEEMSKIGGFVKANLGF